MFVWLLKLKRKLVANDMKGRGRVITSEDKSMFCSLLRLAVLSIAGHTYMRNELRYLRSEAKDVKESKTVGLSQTYGENEKS